MGCTCCSGERPVPEVKMPVEDESLFEVLPLKYKFDTKPDAGVWITGLVVTDQNQIVLCYRDQFKLLVFDTDGSYRQSCEMVNRPYNAAVIPDASKLLVTLPGNKSLQYVDTVTWTVGKEIKTKGFCWGIAVTSNNIAVGGDDEIYIMGLDGRYQKTIWVQGDCVRYLCFGTNKPTNLYFTNQTNKIKCISMEGVQIFSITLQALVAPSGITIDNIGNIYVAGFGSFNIHRLQLAGTDNEHDILLKKDDGIKKPKALSFNKDKAKLFIENDGGRSIFIYNIEIAA